MTTDNSHPDRFTNIRNYKYNPNDTADSPINDELNDEQEAWLNKKFPDDPISAKNKTDRSVDKTTNDNGENDDNSAKDSKDRVTQAELVLESAKQYCSRLFVDEYQTAHVAILVNNHLEVLPLSSRRFRNWISKTLYKDEGIVIDSQTLKDALGVLNAQAEFDGGEPIRLNLRVAASVNNSKITWYYDLTNREWEFIEITSEGWKIVTNLVLFRRFSNQLPQVYPSRKYPGDIFEKFFKLLNLKVKEEGKTEEYKLLLKCYIICLFIPEIPKAVLMPHGHQGSAKTTLSEFIKMLADPSIIRTLSFPRDVNELIQQLSHNYIAYYDNISNLQDWISDQICRAVTGSGSSKRVLYTDDEDFIRNLKRCIGLNGINLAATKPDLLDRGIIIQLSRIEEENRRKLSDLEREFEEIKPQLLGFILDILVKVLKWKEERRHLNLTKLPRMADFGECCEIISRCVGNHDNAFLKAYDENIKVQVQEVIESSQVATCVSSLIIPGEEGDDKQKAPIVWTGTATSLLADLEDIALDLKINVMGKYWPKPPNQLSRRLNEVAPSLREAGIEVEWIRKSGKARTIKICKVSSSSSQARILPEKGDDIPSNGKVSSQRSPQDNHENHARHDDSDDSDDVFPKYKVEAND
jgi:hypothetical protein